MAKLTENYSQFLSDCASGNLPVVSFVDPAFTLLLNFGNDNHPHSDMRNGDAFLAQTSSMRLPTVRTGPIRYS